EIQLRPLVPEVVLVLVLGSSLTLQPRELALDPRPLGGHQLACTILVHDETLASVRYPTRRFTMTGKADFTPEEWHVVLEAPPSAGVIVMTAQRGGTFR